MGSVHVARDTILGRDVAIKFLHDSVSPTAQARFVREARAMAQIDHPNVVRVYRAGAVDDTPFLVTELLDGTPLSELDCPMSVARAWGYAVGIARGLGAAHKAGLLHRDVKPHNMIVTAGGRLKLIDFGLAKAAEPMATGAPTTPAITPASAAGVSGSWRTSSGGTITHAPTDEPARHASGDGTATYAPTDEVAPTTAQGTPPVSLPGRVAGTPRYMAPELWKGEPATPASDVFAAGVVLFELLTGQAPYDEPDKCDFERGRSRRAQLLVDVTPDLPPGWSDLVATCLQPDPVRRFADGDALHRALLGLVPATGEGVEPGCPYPGLTAYSAPQQDLFFGRAREIAAVQARLRRAGVAVVVGDSGVGKSSLCAAGVLPRLSRDAWGPVMSMRPGAEPRPAFERAARERGVDVVADSAPDVAARAIVEFSRDGGWTRPLVFVDQLEELITASDPDQARWLRSVLVGLVDRGAAVLASLRSDCLGALTRLPDLGPLVGDNVIALGPLTSDGLREAIVEPASASGVGFEDQAMVTELVDWALAAPGSLPLLQFALHQMWQHRASDDHTITRASLDQVGGVAGALSHYADTVLAALPESGQGAARTMLLALIDAEGRRQIRTSAELAVPPDDPVLDRLVSSRLVVRHGAGTDSSFSIAHEVLATEWRTLAEWRAEQDDELRARDQLRRAAEQWRGQDRAPALLWSGARLLRARELGAAPGVESDFVRASVRRVRATRVRRGAAAFAAVFAIAALWYAASWQLAADTRRAVERDMARAQVSFERGAALVDNANALRESALVLFRAGKRKAGEAEWDNWTEASRRAAQTLSQAARSADAALARQTDHAPALALAVRVTALRIKVARLRRQPDLEAELQVKLAGSAPGRALARTLNRHGSIEVSWADPRLAVVAVRRYRISSKHWELEDAKVVSQGARLELKWGSYVVVGSSADGNVLVRVPVWLERGSTTSVSLAVPDEVASGMIVIPKGPYWFGLEADDDVRRTVAVRSPAHIRFGAPFLIGRTEVTLGEWLEFVAAQPPKDREALLPDSDEVARGMSMNVALVKGTLRFKMQTVRGGTSVDLSQEEALRYPTRERDAVHLWTDLPVVGVSPSQAVRYLSWLDTTGRVSGARFCTESEWQRAARGADKRRYPRGDWLDDQLENIDTSYGRKPSRFGPNSVGLHPENASPFGVLDMAGNVMEIVRKGKRFRLVGGMWYGASAFAMVTSWQPLEAEQRTPYIGLRVCADYDGPISVVE